MSKVAIVYWSGTGNTEAMAHYVAEGVKKAGGEADMFTSAEFGADKAGEYDRIAFGCPSMGAEQLEESEFQPMFDEVSPVLSGKKIALFGSYGWGDGEWMRTWEEDCLAAGALLACDSVICQDDPDADAIAACQKLAEALKSPETGCASWKNGCGESLRIWACMPPC